MSDFEPGDSLWKLLGHARRVEPSAYFSRRVLRELRLGAGVSTSLRERLLQRFARPLAAAAVMALAILAILPLARQGAVGPGSAESLTVAVEGADSFDPASELAAVEYLGDLMAVADPGQLEDAALADLFF